MTTTAQSVSVAKGLRDVADWLDRHPDLPVYDCRVSILPAGAAEMAAAARAMADGAPLGAVRKEANAAFYEVRRMFGPNVHVAAFDYRERVCEQVCVGVETVKEPDEESEQAAEVAELERRLVRARLAVPTRTVVRDRLEWVCAPLLAADAEVER